MIICPKCGKVETYGIKEYVYRITMFNNNDECVGTTEDAGYRYGQPRCLKCSRIVKFYVDPQKGEVDE